MYGDFEPWDVRGRVFQAFEPMTLTDSLLVPWWCFRYVVTWIVWRLALFLDRRIWVPVQKPIWMWEPYKRFRRWCFDRGVRIPGQLAGNGRHSDLTPFMCPCCLWAGPVCKLVHTYTAVGFGDDWDTVPVDECPRCGYEV